MRKLQLGFAPILLLLFLILLAFVGYAVLQKPSLLMKPSSSSIVGFSPLSSSSTTGESDTLLVKPAEKKGWNILSGKLCDQGSDNCSSAFSIQYPSNWTREGYVLYPYGKTGSQTDPLVVIGTLGHGWPLPIVRKTTTWGEINSSWGKVSSDTLYEGFVGVYISNRSSETGTKVYLIETRFIPSDKAEDFKKTFEQSVASFRYLDNQKVDLLGFKFTR